MTAAETEGSRSNPGSASTVRPLPATIVHVVRQFHPNRGGLEDFVCNLVAEQVRRGHRVRVVTLDSLFSAPEVRLPARDGFRGAEVVRIPWRGSSRYPIAFGVFGHLADADLVHVHAIDFFFDALALWRPVHRRPLVATTHGGFFHTGAHARLKRLWFAGPTRLSCLAYDVVVACGAADAELFAPIAGSRLMRIDNGADLSKFADRASRTPRRTLVTIGRFSSNKRLDRLLDTMNVLEAGDPRWRLEIVGVAADLDAADLGREISARNLEAAVGVHCGASNDEVATIVETASLFVSASEYEGFGLALIEAMSAGLVPVVHGNESFVNLAAEHRGITVTDFASPRCAADAIAGAYAMLEARGAALRGELIASVADLAWEKVADRYEAAYLRAGLAAAETRSRGADGA